MLRFLCFSQGGWNCYDSFIHKANWRPDWSMEKPAKIQIQAKSGCEWNKWSILLTGFSSCLCTSDNAFCRALIFSWLEYNVVISIPLSHRCLGNTCLLALPATEMDTCTCIIVIYTQTMFLFALKLHVFCTLAVHFSTQIIVISTYSAQISLDRSSALYM